MPRSNRLAVALSVLATLGFAAGCSASTADDPEQMNVTKSCLKSRCDEKQSSRRTACADCLSACSRASYRCNSSTACKFSCSDEGTTCSESEERECASSGFVATLPATANPELEAACNRYRAQLTSCGAQAVAPPSACTLFAKTEQPERVATYDCLAKQPCEATEEEVSAACAPALTTLGDEACAPMEGCDSICSKERQAALNLEGGWLRSDVQKVARDCRAAGTCSDVKACLYAWMAAVIPQ